MNERQENISEINNRQMQHNTAITTMQIKNKKQKTKN